MYKYEAISMKEDKVIKGKSQGSVESIRKDLEASGYYLINIKKIYNFKDLFIRELNNKELYIFSTKFATLLSANIQLIEALDILKQGYDKKRMKDSLNNISNSIENGNSLSVAMSREKIFPNFLINLIEAGEESGRLEEILEEASNHYKEKKDLDYKIKNTLMYPIILIMTTIIVIYFFLIYIIPNFISLYESYETQLPKATIFIIRLSDLLTTNKLNIFSIILIFILLSIILNKNKNICYMKDRLLLFIPIYSKIIEYEIIVYFSKIMNLMLENGFNIYKSVKTSNKMISNKFIKSKMNMILVYLEDGNSLSSAFEIMDIFEVNFVSMIKIGEGSGNIGDMFNIINEFYYGELNNLLDNLTKLIEPVMLIILSFIVGFLVIAIALPMFNLVNMII